MAEILYTEFDHLTDGEQATADRLQSLPRDWIVICNKVLPRQGKSSREIDFIVIGSNTVLAIDEKSWGGNIRGTDTIWQRENGDSERSPLNKVDMVSKQLAGFIRNKAPHMRDVRTEFVHGCVSLTRQGQQPQIKDARSPRFVFLFADLLERIQGLDNELGDPQVGSLSAAIRTSLFDLRDRPRRPKQINEYRIQDGYDGIIGSQVCRAVHMEGMERLLTIYATGPNDEENRDFYLQEFRVLQQLSDLGVAPNVYDPFRWADDFLVIPSSVPNGISFGAIPEAETGEELIKELNLIKEVFRSLALVHEKGIIHRSIGADKIYIERNDAGPKAVLTGFYAARRPNSEGFSIGGRLNQINIEDPLIAPELALGYEWADQTSDTYSTSLMYLERLSGLSAERLTDSKDPLEESLSSPTWELLDSTVAEKLKTFFKDTLGNDPPTNEPGEGTGRLSASQCFQRLSTIIAQAQ